MTATPVAHAPHPGAGTGPSRRVGRALTRPAVGQVRRGAVLVLVVAAGMSALVAVQYRTTFAGALDAPSTQALAANPAIRILFGPPFALEDPGGFTVWRTGTPIAVLVGVWAVLTATRLTRGEEEAGRWDLLLGGRIRTAGLVARSLGVLAAAVSLIGVALAAALVAAGTSVTGSMLHAAGVTGLGLGFAALGVCAAQVLPTRAAATGSSVAVLGATLLARMVGDGVDALSGLRWFSPFGLLAEIRPYAGDRPAPLLVLALAPLVLGAAAVVAADRRDTGSGMVPTRNRRRARTRLLQSVGGFALRRALGPLTGWAVGVAAFFLLVGLLAGSVTTFLTQNPRFAELAAAAGFGGLGSPSGYAAAMFTLLTIPAGIYAAVRIAAAAADETSRRAVLLAGLPMSRTRLAGAEITAAAAGVLTLLSTAAVAIAAGTAAAGVPLPFGAAFAGALNVAPVALLCLGAAALTWGCSPRGVAAIGSGPAVGGFLLHVLAPSAGAPGWVAQLSPYAHLAAVPDTAPDWAATAWLTVAAAALTLIGVLGFTRRDLVF